MSDRVDELQSLFAQMKSALVSNDVRAIQTLTLKQQTCMSQLIEEVKTDSSLKLKAQSRYETLRSQLMLNEQLIEQAMVLNESLITTLTSKQSSISYQV